jgi:hypothetical protein
MLGVADGRPLCLLSACPGRRETRLGTGQCTVAASVGPPCRCRRQAKYPGLHSLRHFYASWCINRRVDGGLELPLKVVQARLGHASIQMTADTYGHLFPRGDDGGELAAAERAFLGARSTK